MTNPELSAGGEFELSAQTRNEVALAIGAYASSRASDGEERMRLAVARVSAEARRHAVTSEQMVLAIKHLFERAPRISGDVQKRVEAFDKFVSKCVAAYCSGGDVVRAGMDFTTIDHERYPVGGASRKV